MKCYKPISIKKPKGLGSADRITVPCGNCAACLSSKRESWTIRLFEESKNYLYSLFITLTYDDGHLVYAVSPTVVKRDIQLFFKRLRKKLSLPIRYYTVGEYGTKTQRPHYHIILFSEEEVTSNQLIEAWSDKQLNPIGNIVIGKCSIQSISYVCKYHVLKGKYPTGTAPPFTLMSKGIGRSYIKKMTNYHRHKGMKTHYQYFEHKKALPRYFKEKIFNKIELTIIGEQSREMQSKNDIKAFIEFKANHPESSNPVKEFYKYLLNNNEAFERNFKTKSTKNDKL